jgi:hypothetical protein
LTEVSEVIGVQDDSAWEKVWAPYDEPTYRSVMGYLKPGDVVLEIGAGDLRLSRLMAQVVRQVYAIEIQSRLFEIQPLPLPKNLIELRGDACTLFFPTRINVGVLLMRHCTHFQMYVKKLQAVGCRRMITNARWRMGVEMIDLQSNRMPYSLVTMGWYACICGSTGFKPGSAELYSAEMDTHIDEVEDCPNCRGGLSQVIMPPRPLNVMLND